MTSRENATESARAVYVALCRLEDDLDRLWSGRRDVDDQGVDALALVVVRWQTDTYRKVLRAVMAARELAVDPFEDPAR